MDGGETTVYGFGDFAPRQQDDSLAREYALLASVFVPIEVRDANGSTAEGDFLKLVSETRQRLNLRSLTGDTSETKASTQLLPNRPLTRGTSAPTRTGRRKICGYG
jgi:hypothetical protein